MQVGEWIVDGHSVLVIGGGVAGLQASIDLANNGFQVYLIERQPQIGGTALKLSKLFPTLENAEDVIRPLMESVATNPNIKILTKSEIESVQGSIGNFKVKVAGEQEEIHADVIIVATGFRQYDVKKVSQYKYGQYRNVISGLEYEQMCKKGRITRLDNGEEPKSVAYILCVGSRDEKHLSHCCNIGCLNALKHAYLLRSQYGDEVDAYICYTDMRAVGRGAEEFYRKVRESGVNLIHGEPSEVRELPDGSLTLDVYDQATSKLLSITADLVVLEAGLEPEVDLQERLGIPLGEDGFFKEANPQLAKNETPVEGILLAGAVQEPMNIAEATVQASAAAMKALILMQSPFI